MRIKAVNTTVGIIYGTSLVSVETEQLAFPLPSVIADCGGILGLLTGFNVLMIWEFLVLIVKKTSGRMLAWTKPNQVFQIEPEKLC